MRWQGQRHALQFGTADLELKDNLGNMLRWPATIAFATANLRHPLLGLAGCLAFLNVQFFGSKHQIEIETNDSFPAVGKP